MFVSVLCAADKCGTGYPKESRCTSQRKAVKNFGWELVFPPHSLLSIEKWRSVICSQADNSSLKINFLYKLSLLIFFFFFFEKQP